MDYEEADRNALMRAEDELRKKVWREEKREREERALPSVKPGSKVALFVDWSDLPIPTDTVALTISDDGQPAATVYVQESALVRAITDGRVVGMRAESRAWIERRAREIRKTIQDSPDTRRTFDMSKTDMLTMLNWLYVLTESARELKDES